MTDIEQIQAQYKKMYDAMIRKDEAALEEGPIRFNELLRKMPKMTHATLSVQLKSLEEYGLVKRVQYEAIPPHVEYSLTEIGAKFHPVIAAMESWGNAYIAQMNEGIPQ